MLTPHALTREIAETQERLETLHQEAERHRRRIQLLQRLLEIDGGIVASRPRPSARRGQFEPGSMIGVAIAVLQEAGGPLHLDEIHARMLAKGKVVTKSTLVGGLSKLTRQERTFERTGPNEYTLRPDEPTSEPSEPIPS